MGEGGGHVGKERKATVGPTRSSSEPGQTEGRGPAFPAASFHFSWPAEHSGHLSFQYHAWSIVLLLVTFPFSFFLNLTISLPRLPSVQQLAAVVASVLIG